MKKKISIAAVCVVIIAVIAVVLIQHNTSKKTLQDVFPSLDDTVSIDLRSCHNLPPVFSIVTDSQKIQDIVARIKDTPIRSEEKVEIADGWEFSITLYDADGNRLLSGSFDSNFLKASYDDEYNILYTFDGDDFQFLTELAEDTELTKKFQEDFPSLDDTVSITVSDLSNPEQPVVKRTITDAQQVQEVVTNIKTMPVRGEHKVESEGGCEFGIVLYDADGNEVLNAGFDSEAFKVAYNGENIIYATDDEYLQSLIDLTESSDSSE